jgi:YD repeat-containing protein
VYTYPFYLTQTSSVFDWLTCYQGQDTYLYYTVASYTGTYNYQSCNGTTYTGTVYSLWQQVGNEYLNWYLAQIPTAAAFLSTTGADPLVPTNYMYSGANVPAAWDNTGLALSLRDNIYSTPGREYIIPSQRTQTAYNTFTVYVAKQWSGTNLASQSFIIENWGGGYVPLGGSVLTPATSIAPTGTATASIQPTFNNATLNDMTVVNETNNNLIKTPSTADPVSTVTGNNYHDETDITIKGRGINYAFTRTYNSTPSSSAKLGSLGYGWTHSYAMKLKSNPYGICPDCNATQGDPVQAALNINGKTNSITYTDERGGDHNYLVNSTTLAVTPPQGEFDNLAFDTPVAGQHTLTFRNGTKYVFQSLTSTGAIQIAAGVMQGTPGVSTRLIQIADPYGNQLNFTYDATGRLSNIADNLAVSGRTG